MGWLLCFRTTAAPTNIACPFFAAQLSRETWDTVRAMALAVLAAPRRLEWFESSDSLGSLDDSSESLEPLGSLKSLGSVELDVSDSSVESSLAEESLVISNALRARLEELEMLWDP